jgi:hypothetical protein
MDVGLTFRSITQTMGGPHGTISESLLATCSTTTPTTTLSGKQLIRARSSTTSGGALGCPRETRLTRKFLR